MRAIVLSLLVVITNQSFAQTRLTLQTNAGTARSEGIYNTFLGCLNTISDPTEGFLTVEAWAETSIGLPARSKTAYFSALRDHMVGVYVIQPNKATYDGVPLSLATNGDIAFLMNYNFEGRHLLGVVDVGLIEGEYSVFNVLYFRQTLENHYTDGVSLSIGRNEISESDAKEAMTAEILRHFDIIEREHGDDSENLKKVVNNCCPVSEPRIRAAVQELSHILSEPAACDTYISMLF